MHETNGRIKLSPGLAWTMAGTLVFVGAAYGTLLTNQLRAAERADAVAVDVSEIKSILKENYLTKSESIMIHNELTRRLEVLEKEKEKWTH